jgi:hypothetical protein
MFQTPKVMRQTMPKLQAMNIAIPGVPIGVGFRVFLAVVEHRNETSAFAKPEISRFQAAFKVSKASFVAFGLLMILLPLHCVMMHEERTVILFDFIGTGRIFHLVLDEFQVNRGRDGLNWGRVGRAHTFRR